MLVIGNEVVARDPTRVRLTVFVLSLGAQDRVSILNTP